jgi:hypothetical protein
MGPESQKCWIWWFAKECIPIYEVKSDTGNILPIASIMRSERRKRVLNYD